MAKIVPITLALGKPTRRTRFFTIYSSGRIQYSEAGRERFEQRFKRWGYSLRAIQTATEHFKTVEACEDLELTDIIENGPAVQDPSISEEFITELLESADKKRRQSIRGIILSNNRNRGTEDKKDNPGPSRRD